jgi:hypothetical protein
LLPEDYASADKLDQLLLLLEKHGIELIDESEAEERDRLADDEDGFVTEELEHHLLEEEGEFPAAVIRFACT